MEIVISGAAVVEGRQTFAETDRGIVSQKKMTPVREISNGPGPTVRFQRTAVIPPAARLALSNLPTLRSG
jgi:hypothetical protein